jgi:tRNA(fMet)-specific endonuclease VapC
VDKALLDTDIFSEVLKGKNPHVRARSAVYLSVFGRLTISVVIVVEIVRGFQKVGRTQALEKFAATLSSLDVLVLDADSAVLAGKIHADLERRGLSVGRADPMIAAIAIRHGRVLVTGNTEHFRRIQSLGYDLRLDDWRTANVR